ncbi:MAG: hypothetical protein ABIQ11_00410, partial [Saprospiraceae bacterium]
QDTKASFNYLGQTLGYGLTDRLTIEAELGLFINKTRRSELAGEEIGRGWSNALASIKYSLWKDKLRDWELTTGVGVRFPFSSNLKEDSDGYPLSMDVQPSTGTTGFVGQFFLYKGFIPQGWRFFLLNRIELYGINDIGYQYGKANYTSFFVSRRLNLHWTAILQVRNEWRDYDYWEDILLANTGSNVVFLAPQINLNLAQKWNISLLAELPVLRSYHHSQLGAKYAFALNIIRDFDLAERELLKKE